MRLATSKLRLPVEATKGQFYMKDSKSEEKWNENEAQLYRSVSLTHSSANQQSSSARLCDTRSTGYIYSK